MQESLSLERENRVRSLPLPSEGIRLRWRITGAFAGMTVLLGIIVLLAVHHLTGRALRTQLDQRAAAIATNLSDAASGHVVGKNFLALHALVTKYALLEGVAYAFIEDGKGRVAAHSLGSFPSELKLSLAAGDLRLPRRQVVTLRGNEVYEIRVPILEGQVGAAHVGVWGEVVENEIRQVLLPLIGVIAVVLLAGVVLSLIVARGVSRPILRLREVADRISMGDLDTPVGIESRDEIGDLARSLERMRASLKAAMVRLGRG